MSRPWMVVSLVITLLLGQCSLLAQRGGGRGGRSSPAGSSNSVPSENDQIKDFQRAFALQAKEPQVSFFLILAKDTVAARDKAGDLAQHPERARDQAGLLAYVVENARDDSQEFLKGFSDTQKSGLKAWKKKVEKASSEVGKRWKALNHDIAQRKVADKQMEADAEKLESALTKFDTEQWNLGKKMGIQPPPVEGDYAGDHGTRNLPSKTLLLRNGSSK